MNIPRTLTLLVFSSVILLGSAKPEGVTVARVPNGGIQPQAAVDSTGTLHLVYFRGDPMAGDLFYVQSKDGGLTFSRAIRVNSQPGSAIAVGNIRGARIALGRNGRVHVAWNGSNSAEPKAPGGKVPMLYSRLNDAGTAFEPQRNVIQTAAGIDGGGGIAADPSGRVYVFWHAPLSDGKNEAARRVWVAQSSDGGKTFARERVAWDQPTGACGCCGMEAFSDSHGAVYVLFRSATELVHRDIYLLESRNHGKSFTGTDISKWNVGYCVMSTASLSASPLGVLAAWETEKQVYFGRIDAKSGSLAEPIAAPGAAGNRKYPSIAGNAEGKTLLAWTEGMGWKKGGALAWQVFDRAGHPTGPESRVPGVPVWSLVATFARPGGGFTILY